MWYQIVLSLKILFITKSCVENFKAKIVGGTAVGGNYVCSFAVTLYGFTMTENMICIAKEGKGYLQNMKSFKIRLITRILKFAPLQTI